MTDEAEIVNLDDCPMKPALMVGGIFTFLITLIPLANLACCIPLAIGGFVATARYASVYRIQVPLKMGMKVAILACLIGFGASTLLYNILWAAFDYRLDLSTYVALLNKLAEAMPEASEQLEETIEQLEMQTLGVVELVQQVVWVIVSSGIGGAIGGALATAMFKKGRLAQ